MEIFACKFEIEQDNQVRQQILEAPRIMIERQFISLVEQASQIASPIKIKVSRMIDVHDKFDDKWIERENHLIFKNNACLNIEEQTK